MQLEKPSKRSDGLLYTARVSRGDRPATFAAVAVATTPLGTLGE